ncbi:hypothetical protein ACHAWC_000088, partial [Mediolabrus comicus]
RSRSPKRKHSTRDDDDDDEERRCRSSKRRKKKKSRRSKSTRRRRSYSQSSSSSSSSSSTSQLEEKKKRHKSKHSRKRKYHRDKRSPEGEIKDVIEQTSSSAQKKHNEQLNETDTRKPITSVGIKQQEQPEPEQTKGPMTQAQYLQLQSQIREEIDPVTGRIRLVRGTGEIIERIVTKQEHQLINNNATRGDGDSFAKDV